MKNGVYFHGVWLPWIYSSVPILGEELSCVREIGNPHDPTAVSIQKEIGGTIVTVGQIPKRIFSLTSVF